MKVLVAILYSYRSKLIIFLVFASMLFASIETHNCKPMPEFQCEFLGTQAKTFYDNRGEWNGIYTMTPIRFVQEKVGVCHIKYFYQPVRGSYAIDTGYDFRVFHYTLDNKTCKWKAEKMKTYMSGYLAYD